MVILPGSFSLRHLKNGFTPLDGGINTMAATWQVQAGQQLSKYYTVEQLRRKHSSGLVKGSTRCTRNKGNSFIDLSELLAKEAHKPASRKSRLNRPQPAVASHSSAASLKGLVDHISLAVPVEDETETAHHSNDLYTIPAPHLSVDEASAPPPPPVFPEPQPSAIALAAAKALEAEACSRRDERTATKSVPGRRLPSKSELPLNVADDDDVRSGIRKIGLRQLVMIAIVGGGIAATGMMALWYSTKSGPPTFEDLTNGSLALSTFKSDDPVTIEELHARTQILGVQVGQLTRAVVQRENAAAAVALPELPELPVAKKLPLVAFRQRTLSPANTDELTKLQQHYSTLVKEKGPDGRRLDDATVTVHTGYLAKLAETVDARNTDRKSALHELSEWTKLIFLLQQKRIGSKDSALRQQAATEILRASNNGLTNIYRELSTGDMRFVDLFERSVAAEQSGLLLTRYWYHRTFGRESAEQWLADVLKMVDKAEHEFIRTSISEVDNIVK